jgi:hypothetical protein
MFGRACQGKEKEEEKIFENQSKICFEIGSPFSDVFHQFNSVDKEMINQKENSIIIKH